MSNLKEMLEVSNGSFKKAEEIANEMIESGNKEMILDLCLLYSAQGKYDEIKKLHKEIDWDDSRVRFNKGWLTLRDGDFQQGMKLLNEGRIIRNKMGFISRNFGNKPLATSKPIFTGKEKDTKGKTIILYGEGGLGDQMINIRSASILSEKYGFNVIASVHRSLIPLVSQAKGVTTAIDNNTAPMVGHDYWLPGMASPVSCGYTYKTIGKDIPYLFSNINKSWEYKIPKKEGILNVGIRWSGNPQFENQQFRKFNPNLLTKISNYNKIQCYSFQKDNDVIELDDSIVDLSAYLNDWEDTACALDRMDLIISSCTSVAHCAAAMGKETWIIVPILAYYLWAQDGNKSKWYPTVTLFRQTKFGHWENTFENLYNNLENKIEDM